MYSVLIVDDEVRDRNIVKILLERHYAGQFHFLEAENGAQALEILNSNSVHLLLLDINMPGMSGIDVLRNLKYMPHAIVLTAYDDFEYTRDALRCGVRDYLLKPPLREEFYRAIDMFLEDRGRVTEDIAPQIQSREVFTRDLARQMMYFGDAKKIRGLLNVLDISGRYAQCGILHFEAEEGHDADYILDETESALDNWGVDYAVANCDDGLAVFLFCGEENNTQPLQILSRLAQHLESNMRVMVQVQTGALETVFGGYPKTFLDLIKFEKAENARLSLFRKMDLESAVRRRDFTEAMKILHPALEAMENSGHEDVLKYQLLLALHQCSSQLLSRKATNEAYQKISGIISAHSREQVEETTARYLEWLMHATKPVDTLRNNAVSTILDRVRQDCSQPWSIDALAEEIHVNASYLSHLFKEYTGQCFTDYLAELRIANAVELICTTNMGLAQIGEKVGYSDPNYFSRVFKKRRGIGPREFAKREKSSTNH